MKAATIIDVARQAGTDTGTVSRILTGKASKFRISKQRAEFVKQVADQLGYLPNASAQAFRAGRFGCAAMLMSSSNSSWITPHMFFGLDDALAERDMHLVVSKVPSTKPALNAEMPRVLRTSMVDGVLINYTHQTPDYLAPLIQERHLPMVWVNTRRETSAVYMDNVGAARHITKHFLSLGHTRIDYLDPWEVEPSEHHSRQDRACGYSSVMEEAGLVPRVWRPARHRDEFKALVHEVLDRPDRPTAIICYSFPCVPTIFHEVASLGLSIPRDLSIATYGAEELEAFDLRVAAMVEETYLLGRSCVEMLCEIINGGESEPASRKLPFVWTDNGTTGRR